MSKQDKKKGLKKFSKKYGPQSNILKNIEEWKYCEISENASSIVMVNPYIYDKYEKTVFFGFIDFPKDFKITKQLFKKIEEKALNYSAKRIIGPVNYSTWFNYRWKISGFSEPNIFPEPSNPEYMTEFIKKLGYTLFKTYNSRCIKTEDEKLQYYKKYFDEVKSKGFIFKKYKGSKIFFVIKNLYNLSVESFKDNILYSPISFKMFKNIYISGFKENKKIQPIVDICFYKKQPIGFIFSYKNPYTDNYFVWKTVGVKKDFRKKGIGSAFRYIVHRNAFENNCDFLFYHLFYEKNIVKKLGENGFTKIKKYGLFEKKL